MRQFSVAHDVAVATLVLGAAVAIVGPRRWPGRWVRWLAWALAAVICAGWVGEYVADIIKGIWTVQYSLPLQLTDAVSAVAILALLTRVQLLIELLYFWAFTASALVHRGISGARPGHVPGARPDRLGGREARQDLAGALRDRRGPRSGATRLAHPRW